MLTACCVTTTLVLKPACQMNCYATSHMLPASRKLTALSLCFSMDPIQLLRLSTAALYEVLPRRLEAGAQETAACQTNCCATPRDFLGVAQDTSFKQPLSESISTISAAPTQQSSCICCPDKMAGG